MQGIYILQKTNGTGVLSFFEVLDAPWRWFKQNRNILEVNTYLYDF